MRGSCMLKTEYDFKHIHIQWGIIYDPGWVSRSAARASQIARFMGPIWGPSGADRTQVGPMWALWTLLSGVAIDNLFTRCVCVFVWHNIYLDDLSIKDQCHINSILRKYCIIGMSGCASCVLHTHGVIDDVIRSKSRSNLRIAITRLYIINEDLTKEVFWRSQMKGQSHKVTRWHWHLKGRSSVNFWSIRMKQNSSVGHTHGYVAMATKIQFYFRFP